MNSRHVYVRFDNTTGLNVGDTIYNLANNNACLQVINRSSSSSVCKAIDSCKIEVGEKVFFFKKMPKSIIRKKIKKDTIPTEKEEVELETVVNRPVEQIKGRISIANYSILSDNRDDIHRLMSRVSLDAMNINHSKFSFNFYGAYRELIVPETSTLNGKKFFNIYDFALQYDFDSSVSVTLGRKINYRLSSVGAIDGLQAEKKFNEFVVGAFAGFRPDLLDYSFDPNRFEYGIYVGMESIRKQSHTQVNAGIVDQRNSFISDRKFTFLQGSYRYKKINLFSSAEMDIYSRRFDSTANSFTTSNSDLRITNLYVSMRYRFNRQLSFVMSYDSRKRVIYYESFQTELEQILNNDIARQGWRFRVNARPQKNIFVGAGYSKRFQSDQQNKSDNIHAYLRIIRLPYTGGRFSASYNLNQSNYLKSDVMTVRYSQSLIKNKLQADLYCRQVNFTYLEHNSSTQRFYYGTGLSFYITDGLMFSANIEYSDDTFDKDYRLNTRLIKRFKRKRT